MAKESWVSRCLLTLGLMSLVPSIAVAQSGISGSVKDTSGAFLPGVTVEASSPALIEKVRSVLSDSDGQYKIVDLRPGLYTVTFTLSGFNTVKREGLELPASFTATVNAEMPVGDLKETVTVTGQSPLVDVQNVAQSTTISNELLETLPTQGGRLPQYYTLTIPAVTQAAGGQQGLGTASNTLGIHGSRPGEAQTGIDGFSNRNMDGPGGPNMFFYVNQATVQEVVVSTSSSGADQQMSGVVTNVIPKDGGNQLSGQFFTSYADDKHLQGSNLTPELKAFGLASSGIHQQYDFNIAVGGPIRRDKIWFFSSYRKWSTTLNVPNFYNLTPQAWVYTPDPTRTGVGKQSDQSYALRLTAQISPRNKLSSYFDVQPHIHHNRNYAATVSPEAQTFSPIYPTYLASLIWKSPVSTRLLLEAGATFQNGMLDNRLQTDDERLFQGTRPDPNAIAAIESNTQMQIRAAQSYGITLLSRDVKARAAANYVTGSHAFKAGFDLHSGTRLSDLYRHGDYTVTLRGGSPLSMTLFGPAKFEEALNADIGVFVQDQWTLRKTTLNFGLRYDYLNSEVLEQNVPGNRWLPARHFDPVKGVPIWHDLSPRIGATYDLLGDGKTVVKAFVGQYVAGHSVGLARSVNPITTSVTSANRNWTDDGDFIPECDFSDPGINDECGILSNINFGKNNPNATITDPEILRGYGKRGNNWEVSFALQREMFGRLSVDAGYFRRWYGHQTVTDNLEWTPADFDPYCITVPPDPRLPQGGGNQLCGFYDISRAKASLSRNYVTFASNFGESTEVYNGVDVTLRLRLPMGGQISGGTSTGRTQINTCFVIDSPQALLFCNDATPFLTQVKFSGTYPLPWWGVQFSGNFMSIPGPEISATTYVATNAEIRQTLNRDLASGATGTVTLRLMGPGTLYGDRINKLDFRFAKTVAAGRMRIRPSLDIINVFNSSGALELNTRYGPDWLKPTQIVYPRLFRLSAQIDF